MTTPPENGAEVSVSTPPIGAPEVRPGAYAWTVRGPDGDERVTSDAKDTAAFFAAHVKGREVIVTPDAIVLPGHGVIVVRPGWGWGDDDGDDDEGDDEPEDEPASRLESRSGAGKGW